MDKHIRCFNYLVQITMIVMAAGDATAPVIAAPKHAIREHAALYSELYPQPRYYKVKWHHLLHLPDDLQRVGKMVSCFPMERKHKDIKVHMQQTFKSPERTAVYSYLNSCIVSILSGQTKFTDEYLLNPTDDRSSKAILRVGKVCKGDMLLFTSDDRLRGLGEVLGFLQADDLMCIHLLQLKPQRRNCDKCWKTVHVEETVVTSTRVTHVVPYKIVSEDTIRIIVPTQ